MQPASCVKLSETAHVIRDKQASPLMARQILAWLGHNCFAECKAAYLEAAPLDGTAF